MSRGFVSQQDHRWVMRCDQCGHKTEPRKSQNALPLEEFAAAGWFIAEVFGDWCPKCVSKVGGLGAIEGQPNSVMKAAQP